MCCNVRFLFTISLLALSACTPRGEISYAPEAVRIGDVTPVFIGTTRVLDGGKFGRDRAEAMRFARYDISIPPNRTAGEINWPPRTAKPNPDRHFLTTHEELYPAEANFRADLRRDLAARGNEAVGSGLVLVS